MGVMISRVESQHMVKFNIVDLIGCLSLESLIDEVEFVVSHLQLHGVEDGSESSVSNEA